MLVYLFIFVLLLCTSLKDSKRIKNTIFCILLLFLCFGYMTGSDWRVYENDYYRLPSILSDVLTYSSSTHAEIGYNILVWAFKTMGFGFWPFHILFKCLVFIFLCKVIESFNVSISQYFVIYFSTACFFFIDCPFRNMITVGIFLFSIQYVRRKKIVPYIICCLIASTIHISAIIMVPIYYIYHKKRSINIVFVIFFMLSMYLFSFVGSGLIESINAITATNEYAYERLSSYMESSTFRYSTINYITIYNIIIFIIVFINRKKIEKIQYGTILLNFYYVNQMLLPLATSFRMFSRFTVFIGVLTPLVMIYLFKSISEKQMRFLVFSFVVFFSFAKTVFVLTSDYRYVPYSNYLQYVSEPLPYDYRDSYNYINTPYKK